MKKGKQDNTIDVILFNAVSIIAGNYNNIKRFSLKSTIKNGINNVLKENLDERLGHYRGLVLMCDGKHERFNLKFVGSDPEVKFSRTYGKSEKVYSLENRIPDYFSKPLDDIDEKKENYIHLIQPQYQDSFEKEAISKGFKVRLFDGSNIDQEIIQILEYSPEIRARLGLNNKSPEEIKSLLGL
ncbi:hypothetical protein HOK51_08270 [Candidatus Woesearchaeota archaeon]|jgi:hypothetical protein|nr:hypothetical protein [Candidatus Woesearchaeota archaeon]MBT6519820.1 hypothetical protein [Candidatus Woesearchaeota archaeon]MBT7368199.1 hypothetical protein [Candidatus Woesearchaeota archaeon]